MLGGCHDLMVSHLGSVITSDLSASIFLWAAKRVEVKRAQNTNHGLKLQDLTSLTLLIYVLAQAEIGGRRNILIGLSLDKYSC